MILSELSTKRLLTKMHKKDFIQFVQNNPKLVKIRPSERYPGLLVVKYTKRVFFDGLWNDYLEECRGLVLNDNYDPVIVPFRKIYNRGEQGTDIPLDEEVVAVEKINGFMAAITFVEGYGAVVSTTGSLDSPFVKLAEKHLRTPQILDFVQNLGIGYTWLFEIVDEADPHIIVEQEGAYLIGARRVDSVHFLSEVMLDEEMLDADAKLMGVRRPQWGVAYFKSVVQAAKECQIEGFVVHALRTSLKLKSPFYLLSKMFGRMSVTKFAELLENRPALKARMDEEYYPIIDYLYDNREHFVTLDEQKKIALVQNYFEGMGTRYGT